MAKKEETRKNIMKVALKLFSAEGYYQTTTKKIADAAGVNEITLFRHFGSKENLFQETTDFYVQELDIKREVLSLIKDDFYESVHEISMDYLDFCFKNEKMYKIQMRLTDNEREFVRLKLSRNFKQELEAYFKALNEKKVVTGDPELMAVTLIESILGAYTVYLLSSNSFTKIDIRKLVTEHTKMFCAYYETRS